MGAAERRDPVVGMHILRLIECACVLIVSAHHLVRHRLHKARGRKHEQLLRIIQQIQEASGSQSVFQWNSVKEAPPASMDVSGLEPGQVLVNCVSECMMVDHSIRSACVDLHRRSLLHTRMLEETFTGSRQVFSLSDVYEDWNLDPHPQH